MLPQKGILTLTPASINAFKAKDRQAAQVLQVINYLFFQLF